MATSTIIRSVTEALLTILQNDLAGPGGIMPAIAKRLTAEDIRNVSSYLQGLR